MHIPGISALEGDGQHSAARLNLLGSWAFTVIGCLYCFFVCRALERTVPIFSQLFTGMGVSLPFSTHVLIASYSWFFPAL